MQDGVFELFDREDGCIAGRLRRTSPT